MQHPGYCVRCGKPTAGRRRKYCENGCRPRSKFGNRIVSIKGKTFHSKKEHRDYLKLKALQDAGVIRDLQTQVKFPLKVYGVFVCSYVADFTWVDVATSQLVVADSKGYKTRDYRLKKKLMRAIKKQEIVEL